MLKLTRAVLDISNYNLILLIKVTCHRIIITSLLAANNTVNKMLPWADFFV